MAEPSWTVEDFAVASLRALVVDDHPFARLYVGTVLRSCGIDWVGASHGEEALAISAPWDIDLIVTDLEMPHMNGFEFLEHVMAGAFGAPYPPVIICSAKLSEPRTVARFAHLKNVTLLSKPYQPRDLVWAIRDVFGERDTESALFG